MPGRGAESRGRGVGGTSWRRWFPSWALEDWERFGQREKVGEKFQAEGRASTKAKWRATWGGRGREGDGKAEGVRGGLGPTHTISSRPEDPLNADPEHPGALPLRSRTPAGAEKRGSRRGLNSQTPRLANPAVSTAVPGRRARRDASCSRLS